MNAIVKVQRCPLSTDGYPCLIYAGADRLHLVQVGKLPPAIKKAMGGRLKAYFDAEWDGSNWLIGERVADQPW
jgi:hypothetical protein